MRKESAAIRRMFGAIAPRYDLLNHVLSGGLDLLWRRAAVRAVLAEIAPAPPRRRLRSRKGRPPASEASTRPRRAPVGGRGYRVLDLCAGTLDLACALSDSRRFDGRAVALDFSLPMLRRGRFKLGGRRARQIVALCGDGLALPLRDGTFDAVMVGFGVRNFEDLDRGLAEARRILAPGGQLVVLEFSRPAHPVVAGACRLYNTRVLPAVGAAVSGHPDAYRYLPASIAEFPDGVALARRLEAAGFTGIRFRPLSGGIVTLYEARAAT